MSSLGTGMILGCVSCDANHVSFPLLGMFILSLEWYVLLQK